VQLGFVSEATLRDALSEKLGLQSVDLAHIIVDPAALKLVPRDMARRYRIFRWRSTDQQRSSSSRCTTPTTSSPRPAARLPQGRAEIELRLAGESEIERAIDQYYGHELSIDGILHEIETGEIDYGSLSAEGDEYSQPVVRLISALLADAVERGASDIHFEPEQNFLRIRYRIDGVLRQIRACTNLLAGDGGAHQGDGGMNIAETRAPQDGRISPVMSGRVGRFPRRQPADHPRREHRAAHPRPAEGHRAAREAGLERKHLELLKLMIARPEGIILVTGPTGSGKTTTLYSMLNHINAEGINIMTLEDPVEYPMTLIRQTSVAKPPSSTSPTASAR
jgi:type II secretory ATPase GspE/PulE/Tfp pilus assembly ATPase PilB-like protein